MRNTESKTVRPDEAVTVRQVPAEPAPQPVRDYSNQKYSVYVSTHPGKLRDDNEDNFVVDRTVRPGAKMQENLKGYDVTEPLVCGVFDGMGGEANGELASQIAADTAVSIYKQLKKNPRHPDKPVEEFVKDSNAGIVQMLADNKARRGGSTFVMAVLIGGMVHAYSLGDSRLYLLSNSQLTQISNDHTLAMKKYMANIYTLEEAMASPDSHKLTAFLGLDAENNGLDFEKYPPFRMGVGDRLLLCSDGLYDMCSDAEIFETINTDSDTVSLDLVKKAIDNGGVDNITCVVVTRTE